jgi:putative tryptophan/tyrosine transport system substrate-binding protein
MGNVGYPQAVLEMGEVQTVARTLGLELAPLEIRRVEDIAPAFEALKAQADALYVVGDALTFANLTRIITFAHTARLSRRKALPPNRPAYRTRSGDRRSSG